MTAKITEPSWGGLWSAIVMAPVEMPTSDNFDNVVISGLAVWLVNPRGIMDRAASIDKTCGTGSRQQPTRYRHIGRIFVHVDQKFAAAGETKTVRNKSRKW